MERSASDLTVRMLAPIVRLRELLARPGGITREAAVSRANAAVEALREEVLSSVVTTIDDIGALVRTVPAGPLEPSRIELLLEKIDQIENIAGTYRLQSLEQTAHLFCDLLLAQAGLAQNRPDTLDVFVQALRLFAVESGTNADGHLHVLEQLAMVLDHVEDRTEQSPGPDGAAAAASDDRRE